MRLREQVRRLGQHTESIRGDLEVLARSCGSVFWLSGSGGFDYLGKSLASKIEEMRERLKSIEAIMGVEWAHFDAETRHVKVPAKATKKGES